MSPLSLRARLLRTLLVSSSLVVLAVPAAQAAQFGQVGGPIGSPGSGNGDLISPSYVDGRVNTAPDPDVLEVFAGDLVPLNDVDGNLRYRVQRLDAADGSYLSTVVDIPTVGAEWANLVPGQIAADATNNRLYVAFTDDNGDASALRWYNATSGGSATAFAVAQFTGAGRLFLGNVTTPLAVSPVGDVYVAGTLANDTPQIRRLNSGGSAVQSAGQPIRFPTDAVVTDTPFVDIAVGPDGDVYALDQIQDAGGSQVARVRRFSDTGAQEASFNPAYDPDGAGPQSAASTGSSRIAVGAANEIYLDTDQGVAQFTQAGTLERQWGGLGAGVCEFAARPVGLGMLGADVLAIDRGIVLGQPVAQVRRFGEPGTGCGFDNQPPNNVNFTGDPLNPIKNQTVTFTATAADDNGTVGLTYAWDFGAGYGTPSTSLVATTTFATAGAKQVKLKVTDGDGASTEVTRTIGVRSQAPTASFTIAPAAPQTGQSVQFDASASTDGDGAVTGYEWDLDGDGAYEATGKTPSTTYASAGTITVRLRVTDDDGDKQTTERSLTITAAAVAAPPAPAPAPAPVVAPAVTIAGAGLTADGKGVVKVSLKCPPGGSACQSVVALQTAGPVAAAKAKKRVVALGRASVTIPAGKTVVVRVKLSAAGRKALAKLKRVKAKVTVTTTAGASTTSRSRVLTLKAPAKKKAKN